MKYTEEFERFWKDYPARLNRESGRYYKVGKWEAFQVWKKLSQKDRNDILLKVKYMKSGQFVLDAHRWLKKRRFDDMELPRPKQRVVISQKPKKVETPEEIQKKAERAEKGRLWYAEYEKRKKRLFETRTVPQGDTRSISDKVNEQRQKLANHS